MKIFRVDFVDFLLSSLSLERFLSIDCWVTWPMKRTMMGRGVSCGVGENLGTRWLMSMSCDLIVIPNDLPRPIILSSVALFLYTHDSEIILPECCSPRSIRSVRVLMVLSLSSTLWVSSLTSLSSLSFCFTSKLSSSLINGLIHSETATDIIDSTFGSWKVLIKRSRNGSVYHPCPLQFRLAVYSWYRIPRLTVRGRTRGSMLARAFVVNIRAIRGCKLLVPVTLWGWWSFLHKVLVYIFNRRGIQ